jgi:hypothetical protein
MSKYISEDVGVIVDSPILKRNWGYRVVSKVILD